MSRVDLTHRGMTLIAVLASCSSFVPHAAAQQWNREPREIVIAGKVVGPDGQPIKGATVHLWPSCRIEGDAKTLTTTTAEDGAFRFQSRRHRIDDGDRSTGHVLVALAATYGPGRIFVEQSTKTDCLIQLAADHPVEGRVIDLAGKPIPGVTVTVVNIFANETNDLGRVLKALRDPRQVLPEDHRLYGMYLDELCDVTLAATTGKDGRFRLAGLGRERVVKLRLEGPTVETDETYVLTRREPRLLLRGRDLDVFPFVENEMVHGAEFSHPLASSAPIEGVVRDRDTGKPLAGIIVTSRASKVLVRTRSGSEGRYRLTGAPLRNRRLWADEEDFRHQFFGDGPIVPDGEPGVTTRVDFALQRGIDVMVRVKDRVTGKPVEVALSYRTVPGNPADDRPMGDLVATTSSGSLRVLAQPGPGVVIAYSDGQYLVGHGIEEAKKHLPKQAADYVESLRESISAFGAISPTVGKPISLDLLVDPGRETWGRCFGPNGLPLGSVDIHGQACGVWVTSMSDGHFHISGFDGKTPRQFRFLHGEKKLATVVNLKGDEPLSFSVRLQPCATLKVRLRDENGEAIPNEGILFTYGSPPHQHDGDTLPWNLRNGVSTIDCLPAGVEVTAVVRTVPLRGGRTRSATLFEKVTFKPGEVRDLGLRKISFPED